jgi:serine/threonine-protein kinase haspin
MQTDDLTHINPTEHGDLKLGHSGLEITIIDYGLSRATLDEKIAYNDLEQSVELFQGEGTNANENMQYDNYRRMRNYLSTGERLPTPVTAKSKSIEASGHTWAEYTPYSNVLWIRYLYFYLERNFKKHGGVKAELKEFQGQTKEFKTKLDPRTAVHNGAFESAQEVLMFVVEKGWVSQEQLEERGVDSSFLSEAEA